jgi:hypothetical protein
MERAKHGIKKLAKQLSLTPQTNRLVDAAEAITLDPGSSEDASYQHAILCQVGMPRKRTEGLTFERRNGGASLLLTAGKLFNGRNWIQQPLPYGPKARLILINITTHAVRNRNPTVDVGRSTREFMLRVGLDDYGSAYRSLKTQIRALAACRMQLAGRIGDRITQFDAQPIRRMDTWLTPNPDQQTLWPGTVELTQDYYESCVQAATPLDERAVAALSGSALSLDVYAWLAHRLWRIRDPKGVLVPWRNLQDQFGQYGLLANFKTKFLISLSQNKLAYPDAKVEVLPEGLLLRTSKPPIPRVLITG